MKAGSMTYLLLGIGGAFISLVNLAELLSGQGDLLDLLAACFFTILSADGFVRIRKEHKEFARMYMKAFINYI